MNVGQPPSCQQSLAAPAPAEEEEQARSTHSAQPSREYTAPLASWAFEQEPAALISETPPPPDWTRAKPETSAAAEEETIRYKPVPVITAASPATTPDTGAQPSAESADAARGASAGLATPSFPRDATGLAVPIPPNSNRPPSTTDDTTSRSTKRRGWRARKRRSVPRLLTGQHHATARQLDLMQLAGQAYGLPLGRNHAGFTVPLTLFAPTPMSVALVGASWAARLLAYRALRFGAKVLVFTDRPAGWADLGKAATGRRDRVAVLAPGSTVNTVASADAPVLSLYDAGSPPSPPEAVPWQTRVMLVHQFTPELASVATRADILLMQRLTTAEASIAANAHRFTTRTVEQLRSLRDDMMAVLTKKVSDYVWLDPSSGELAELGVPGRY